MATRYGLEVLVVSNSRMRIPHGKLITQIIVDNQFDAADNWIAEHVEADDIVVSSDIPLASRCLKKGARVLNSNGRVFSKESIGNALADRELLAELREMGTMTGGPAPFAAQDRSRFLQRLDDAIQASLKTARSQALKKTVPQGGTA